MKEKVAEGSITENPRTTLLYKVQNPQRMNS